MSGSETVTLLGAEMRRLVTAIPLVKELLDDGIVLIGGLAVLSRLEVPHRATTDLDTAASRRPGEPRGLEVLLADSRTEPAEAAGVLLTTHDGEVKVDLIEIDPDPIQAMPEDPNDALFELSHQWAISSAEAMHLRSQDQAGEVLTAVTILVARPGPLVAMKLQSAMNRGQEKEATDLLDIVTLVLDRATGPAVLRELAAAPEQLRAAALEHVAHWFEREATRTLRTIQSIPEGRWVTTSDIAAVGDALQAALE